MKDTVDPHHLGIIAATLPSNMNRHRPWRSPAGLVSSTKLVTRTIAPRLQRWRWVIDTKPFVHPSPPSVRGTSSKSTPAGCWRDGPSTSVISRLCYTDDLFLVVATSGVHQFDTRWIFEVGGSYTSPRACHIYRNFRVLAVRTIARSLGTKNPIFTRGNRGSRNLARSHASTGGLGFHG